MPMSFDGIAAVVTGIPFTNPVRGRILYNLIVENQYRRCLELGFAHGAGSMYIAGALATLDPPGRLICVDNQSATRRQPHIADLLERTGLGPYVEPVFHDLGYDWYLMEHLDQQRPNFDFCFIDGAHTWEHDGFAFFLVAAVLNSGGLIVFDDLDWSYATSVALRDQPRVAAMDSRRRETPQVRKVFELLVRPDRRFECWEANGWGYARKR